MEKHLLLKSSKQYFSFLQKGLDEAFEFINQESEETRQFVVAAEEVFSNICRHSYPNNEGKIEIYIKANANTIELVYFDWGQSANRLNIPTNLSEVQESGGLGLYLINVFSDFYHYEHNGIHNVTTLRKSFV